jgi:hypothetical protein
MRRCARLRARERELSAESLLATIENETTEQRGRIVEQVRGGTSTVCAPRC